MDTTADTRPTKSASDLSEELLAIILRKLPPPALSRCCQASRTLQEMSNDAWHALCIELDMPDRYAHDSQKSWLLRYQQYRCQELHLFGPKIGHAGEFVNHDPRSVVLSGLQITQASFGMKHAAALTTNGTVLTWGGGLEGELGHGVLSDEPHPKAVVFGDEFEGESLVFQQVSCGYARTGCLTVDGRVFEWGVRGNGADTESEYYSSPHLVDTLTNITELSMGGHHTAACDGSKVYVWGNNYNGQLGLGTTDTQHHLEPSLVPDLPLIGKVECGYGHVLALSHTGATFAWGRNNFGQCGNGLQSRAQDTPVEVPTLVGKRVLSLGAGTFHSVVVSEGGRVYCAGANNNGQLGQGDCAHYESVGFVEAVLGDGSEALAVRVSCGSNHCAILAQDGGIYTWGFGKFGQLGRAVDDGSPGWSAAPGVVPVSGGVINVTCGYENLAVMMPPEGAASSDAQVQLQNAMRWLKSTVVSTRQWFWR